jgi:hypothetical protein
MDRWNECGGGRGRAGRPSWVRGDGHSETWPKPQHLQVQLPTERDSRREGFVCPASHRSTTFDNVLIHILGNAVTGGSETQAGFWGGGHLRLPYSSLTYYGFEEGAQLRRRSPELSEHY